MMDALGLGVAWPRCMCLTESDRRVRVSLHVSKYLLSVVHPQAHSQARTDREFEPDLMGVSVILG